MHKDELTKGKDDWFNYVNKKKDIKSEQEKDKKNNEEKSKQVAEKRAKRKIKPPGEGFQLG